MEEKTIMEIVDEEINALLPPDEGFKAVFKNLYTLILIM